MLRSLSRHINFQPLTCPSLPLWPIQDLARRYSNSALWGLSRRNPFRRACIALAHAKYFEAFILIVIVMNCITLAMSSPRQEFDSTALGIGLGRVEYFFTAVFTFEMLLKMVSQGLMFGKRAYFKDGAWCHVHTSDAATTAMAALNCQRWSVCKLYPMFPVCLSEAVSPA